MLPQKQRVVLWAFDRLYREFAWAYDFVARVVSRGLWPDWTRAALPFVSGSLLELGCGTGYVQASAEFPAIGLDRSPQMLRQAQRRAPAAQLVRGSAETLPFPAAAFDSVLATFPAPYIAAPSTLAEIRRVLRQGGRLIIVDGAHFVRPGWYERVVGGLARVTTGWDTRRERPLPYVGYLNAAGATTVAHVVPVANSAVTVVVATWP
jgi:ubiquinone/menaquinone biosynthesis C-methylase UbiE